MWVFLPVNEYITAFISWYLKLSQGLSPGATFTKTFLNPDLDAYSEAAGDSRLHRLCRGLLKWLLHRLLHHHHHHHQRWPLCTIRVWRHTWEAALGAPSPGASSGSTPCTGSRRSTSRRFAWRSSCLILAKLESSTTVNSSLQ